MARTKSKAARPCPQGGRGLQRRDQNGPFKNWGNTRHSFIRSFIQQTFIESLGAGPRGSTQKSLSLVAEETKLTGQVRKSASTEEDKYCQEESGRKGQAMQGVREERCDFNR